MNKPIDQSHWIKEGAFLAGEYPRNLDEVASKQKLKKFVDFGINSFVDLTEENELEPYENLLHEMDQNEVTYKRFPIRDVSVPENKNEVAALLDYIDREIHEGKIVYLHCWGGIGRTGTIAGCWLSRQGDKGPMALTKLSEKWQDNPKSQERVSPETEAQKQFVLNWDEPLN